MDSSMKQMSVPSAGVSADGKKCRLAARQDQLSLAAVRTRRENLKIKYRRCVVLSLEKQSV